ncbi:hypothetical protein [Pseudoxanthomonas sp. z9]|uniref:hypothetical protein n=1 Tax=Pseudoxanthomonas sp. z9 TaxID=2584942 RepID=UPI0011431449|nr:hypothetical protein [Pseudoxanthomonas sp. z9]MCL6710974.1 hypothetical protein [Pseudomonas sp. R2.Fl]
MSDWQHDLRNELNLILYANSIAREALAQGQIDDVRSGLDRIDMAVVQCGALLDRMVIGGSPLQGEAGAAPRG